MTALVQQFFQPYIFFDTLNNTAILYETLSEEEASYRNNVLIKNNSFCIWIPTDIMPNLQLEAFNETEKSS